MLKFTSATMLRIAVERQFASLSAPSNAADVVADARAAANDGPMMDDTRAAANNGPMMDDAGAAAHNDAAAPTVPTDSSAPTQAGAQGVATPVPTGALPAVVIPAVAIAPVDERGVFDRQLHLNVARNHAVAYRGFRRIGQRHRRGGQEGERENELPKHLSYPFQRRLFRRN
jgi:hypothetical protein